ncbi:hypothetical protein ACI2OX_02555 [Bacillus sp. N9]
MLTISVSADVLGPFVIKQFIDEHVLGIEDHWLETTQEKSAVSAFGKRYVRERYAEEKTGTRVTILQSGRSFYFVDGKYH